MSESKTPRTDIEFNAIANKWPLSGNGDEWYNRCSETLNFARTLELELNEARASASSWEKRYSIAISKDAETEQLLRSQLTTAQQDLAKIAKALRTQQQRYHDLSEEVDELKKDKERLDWLNNQPTDVEPDGDLLIWATPFTYPSAYSTGDETIRQAIDSAMKGTK